MKITDVRTTMVSVPLSMAGRMQPVTMWYETRYANNECITYIDTDEGITGIGVQGEQRLIMDVARPRLIGKDPFDIEAVEKGLGDNIRGRWHLDTKTMAAIDNALWDIVGKACGQPLYKLWGGKVNDPINVRYWIDCRSPEEQAREAAIGVQRGWKSFKIKLGTGPKEDLERVRAVREAVGDDVELCFDLNGGYPMHVAINTFKKMAKYNISSIEDPVPCFWPYDAGALDSMADIRRITGIPIAAHSHGPNCLEYVMALVQKRAADMLHLNVSYVGSILECKRLCAVAEAGGMIVTGQSTCAELGPRNALLLHLITSERAFRGTNDSSTHHLEPPASDIIKNEFRTVNGTLKVPEGPGLGVELDEVKVAHFHELYKEGKLFDGPGMGRGDPHLWF